LNNKLYEKALDYFSKATPLPDAYIGKITCRLKLRRASDLNVIETHFNHIEKDYSSPIYQNFSNHYIKTLKIYFNFWTENNINYVEELKEIENKNFFKTNKLIEELIESISEHSENMNSRLSDRSDK
ncbi:MAG: hypothetical protein ACQESP_07735, partial [Candidatus Muiribacteriota bacterium]